MAVERVHVKTERITVLPPIAGPLRAGARPSRGSESSRRPRPLPRGVRRVSRQLLAAQEPRAPSRGDGARRARGTGVPARPLRRARREPREAARPHRGAGSRGERAPPPLSRRRGRHGPPRRSRVPRLSVALRGLRASRARGDGARDAGRVLRSSRAARGRARGGALLRPRGRGGHRRDDARVSGRKKRRASALVRKGLERAERYAGIDVAGGYHELLGAAAE